MGRRSRRSSTQRITTQRCAAPQSVVLCQVTTILSPILMVPQVEKLTKECDTLRAKLNEMVANNQTCVLAGPECKTQRVPCFVRPG